MKMSDFHCLENACQTSFDILNAYYSFDTIPQMENFILPPLRNGHFVNRTLFEEAENDFYIGIQFSQSVFEDVLKNTGKYNSNIELHTVSVIAEESSHFKFLLDAVFQNCRVSLLEIETLGEIDRFLCLMHWNQKNKNLQLQKSWRNIHDICDSVFQGNRFENLTSNKSLYIEAENRAFYHLKEAFFHEWDYSILDFSTVNQRAAKYLKELRERFLK